ncbi:hypothetical protein ACFWG0_28285 [Streptomyces yangpuensis]|uniref:hypothetical protein n=1 Tax=Streptomyces yangpuensis TaxID=1648182 RepID=UPI00365FABB7
MDKLLELASALASGAVVAVLASWLTSRARNHQERQAEIGALRVQADAMTVVVVELQSAVAVNRLLWHGRAERARSFLLTMLALTGGAARARIAGGTDVQSGLVGFGQAAELLSRERVASKQTAAAVREPLTRAATAAAPLMRSSDSDVVTATEQLPNALAPVDQLQCRCDRALYRAGLAYFLHVYRCLLFGLLPGGRSRLLTRALTCGTLSPPGRPLSRHVERSVTPDVRGQRVRAGHRRRHGAAFGRRRQTDLLGGAGDRSVKPAGPPPRRRTPTSTARTPQRDTAPTTAPAAPHTGHATATLNTLQGPASPPERAGSAVQPPRQAAQQCAARRPTTLLYRA